MARTSRLPTRNYPVLENTCSRQPTRWLRHRLARCAPFILGKFDQFRPPPPPALDSPQYLRDLAEVKLLGEKESATRTKVQTEIAFYTRPLPGYIAWNIIARHAVQAKALDIEISESNGTPKFCDNGCADCYLGHEIQLQFLASCTPNPRQWVGTELDSFAD